MSMMLSMFDYSTKKPAVEHERNISYARDQHDT